MINDVHILVSYDVYDTEHNKSRKIIISDEK